MANQYVQWIAEEAERRGIDPTLALATAKQESNFDPYAQNPKSSAKGLFQFINANWEDYGIDPRAPETNDPHTQITLGVDRIKKNYDGLSVKLGRSPEPHEVYLAHVFGLRGSSLILGADDSADLRTARPEAVFKANPWIDGNGLRTVGDLKGWFRRKTDARLAEVTPMLDPFGAAGTPGTATTAETPARLDRDTAMSQLRVKGRSVTDFAGLTNSAETGAVVENQAPAPAADPKARLTEGAASWPLHNFKPEEFRSKDGAPLDLSLQAALALDRTREEFGEPIAITSAHRSKGHNTRVGGAPGSRHVAGDAFDVDLSGMAPEVRERFLLLSMKNGFTSFGFYANSPDMLHVDTRKDGRAWFRDGKGKNFLKWNVDGAAQNFPASHWANKVFKEHYRLGKGPTASAAEAAVNPKFAAAVTPAEAAQTVQPPGLEIPTGAAGTVTQLDTVPESPFTQTELDAQAKAAEEAKPSWSQIPYDTIRAEWGLFAGGESASRYAHDPKWSASDSWIKDNLGHLPLDYWNGVENTVSAEHALGFAKAANEAYEVEKRLASLGWGGVAARFTAAALDPVAIATILASDAALTPFVLANKGARFARMIRGATSGVAGAGTSAGLLYANKPGATSRDVAYALAGGLVFGALFNAGRGSLNRDEFEALAAVGHSVRRDIEASPSGGFIDGAKSAGAAMNPNVQRPLNQTASEALEEARLNPAAKPAMAAARFDAAGRTLNSTHPLAAKTMDGLAEDAVGRAGHATNTLSATEYQSWFHRRQMNAFYKAVTPLWREYANEQGVGRFAFKQRAELYDDFMRQITRSIRDPSAEVSAQAKKAATAAADRFEDILTHAKEPGLKDGIVLEPVKGFEDVKFNREYAPRIWLGNRIAEARARFGDATMEKFIASAFLARRPIVRPKDIPSRTGEAAGEAAEAGLDPRAIVDEIELSQKFGKVFWKRLREHQSNASSDLSRQLGGDDIDGLKEQLLQGLDGVDGVTADDVEKIIDSLRVSDHGGYARARQRAMLDENFSAQVRGINGEVVPFRLDDLLENNMERLFGMYSRNLSGAISLARAGYNSVAAFNRRLEHISKSADEVKGYGEKDLERDIRNLSYVGTYITGSPIGQYGAELFAARSSNAGQIIRLIRDLNFTRMMGQLGFAQVVEAGNVLGTVGIKSALAGVPSMRSLWRNMRTGELDDDLARELEAAVGLGTDRVRGATEFRYEDFGNYLDPYEGKWMAKMSSYLEAGKIGVGELSGATMVNTVLHRWVMRAVAQKFSDIAFKKGGWTQRRLAAYGLDEEMAGRVSAELTTHAQHVKSMVSSKRLTQLNLDKWDPAVRETFEQVMYRAARHIVQENDPGNLPAFLSKPFWQMVSQFRVFMLAAHSKQLLHGLHVRDVTTTTAFLGTSVMAGLVYMLQTYALSASQRDPKKFLKEKLAIDRIGAASFGRAGWSGLAPTLADNLAYDFGYQTPFGTRTSGLGASGLLQNPTWDFLTSAAHVPFDIIRSAVRDDYDYSEQDFRRLRGLLPLGNTLPIATGLGVIGAQLPATRKD